MPIRSFRRKGTGKALPTGSSTPASGAGRIARAAAITDDGANDPRGILGLSLLYSPSEPSTDLIFVHGLGGGSRKTWSKSPSLMHYWPQEWLPKDPVFKNVRVHSFGYDSDWAKWKGDCLNVNHFGKSLLGAMSTSPYLNDAENPVPIVLIGHSMGGLVIKKAYILARQNRAYEALAKRIHTVYFLATPHRGSDSAKLLGNILQLTFSARAYVTDLERGSAAIQSINHGFQQYSADINLWSLYETQKVSVGIFSTLIVDPESAVLGYPEEKQIPVNADHRSICKFDTPTDPNYLILRNALASTVKTIFSTEQTSKEKIRRNQLACLKDYLGAPEVPEDDLAAVDDARLTGTCEWFSARSSYIDWKDFRPDAPNILWVNGKPATGKSVLAGYVIGQLQKMNVDCSYFFFKFGDQSKSRINACLRSLAFQMASVNVQARKMVLEMQQNNITLDADNERTIWQKLFASGIFQEKLPKQYWVIDALDECVNPMTFFNVVLAKLDRAIPLRILITSRDAPDLEKQFRGLGADNLRSEKITILDTQLDMKLLVEQRADSLAVEDGERRRLLVERILEKSKGSFLWTVMVLGELSNTYGDKEIDQVIDEVPRGMEPFYQRSLDTMSNARHGQKLAKAILVWTTCVTRPLTVSELQEALRLDINDNFAKLDESIAALCGHFVTVDRFHKVQMIHATAREFLLNEDLKSDFAVKKMEAHTRIARACLKYLTGEEMRPPRNSRRPALTRKRAEISHYACSAFSYHLANADPVVDDILSLVEGFLRSNVLSWIEVAARKRDLGILIRAAKDLKSYLSSRAAGRPTFGNEMQTIRGWTTDLMRLVAKFANALITSPSAIYALVLPLCPTDSIIYKAATPGRKLLVLGASDAQWDDRLSCMHYRQDQTSAVCYGKELFAVGLFTGSITLYHATTCQEFKILDHGEPVKFLRFRRKSDLMASCGMMTIRVWDIRTGDLVYQFKAPERPIDLEFDDNILLAASRKNYLAGWDLDNHGVKCADMPWTNSGEDTSTLALGTPCAAAISTSHKMLAVAYARQPIMLWDLEVDEYYGSCGRNVHPVTAHVVTSLVFHPNSMIRLLAASYLDGMLALMDPFDDHILVQFRGECHNLAASPDGRFLGGAAGPTIHVYDFETLKLVYRVKASNSYIKQLAFSEDGLHIVDIRGSQCNVWEPAALFGGSVSDESSEVSSGSIVDAVASDAGVKTSALALQPEGEVIFCGKSDGSVSIYDLKSGNPVRVLYCHKSRVRNLTWWSKSAIVMSVDISNAIYAWKLKKTQTDGWMPEKMILQSRLYGGHSIIQVLQDEVTGKFILSTRETDHLWSINGEEVNLRAYSDKPRVRRWLQHPGSPLHLISTDGAVARIYSWSDLSEIAKIDLGTDITGLQIKSCIPYKIDQCTRIILEFSELDGAAATRGLHLFDASFLNIMNFSLGSRERAGATASENISEEDIAASLKASIALYGAQLVTVADRVAHIINILDSGRVIFLDNTSWVCSMDLREVRGSSVSYLRHFFVPYDWYSGTRDIVCAATQRDIVFARNDGVAIIRDGLEYVEKVNIRTGEDS